MQLTAEEKCRTRKSQLPQILRVETAPVQIVHDAEGCISVRLQPWCGSMPITQTELEAKIISLIPFPRDPRYLFFVHLTAS
jgi:hypothetical protein